MNKFQVSSFKFQAILFAIVFLAVSCSPFKPPTTAGVAKTINGGVDWTAQNSLKSGQGSLATLDVAKLDFDPKNKEIVFVSGYNDGLYKSEDSGVTWTRILSKIFTYDFAIHPFDSNIIYSAGTFADKGRVVKTTDGGKSWEEIYSEAANAVTVRSVALNPVQANQIMLGNSSGNLVLSQDAGKSWKLVKTFEDRINRVLWQNGKVYVLVRGKGLYRSTNLESGEFVDLTADLTKQKYFFDNFSGMSEQVFNQVFIDKTSGSLIYLTAGRGLFKTVDEGKTWEKLNLPGKHNSDLPVRAITLAKTSSNVVLVSVGTVVYRSTDGGKSWQTQEVVSSGFVNYLLIDPQLPQIVYAGNYVSK